MCIHYGVPYTPRARREGKKDEDTERKKREKQEAQKATASPALLPTSSHHIYLLVGPYCVCV